MAREVLADLEASLSASLATSREVYHGRGWTGYRSESNAHPGFNYAIPNSAASSADIPGIVSVFQNWQRLPRLEYFSGLWPDWQAPLLENGFALASAAPVMILRPGALILVRDDQVKPVETYEQYKAAIKVADLAFGGSGLAADESAWKRASDGNHRYAFIEIDGQVVATACLAGGGEIPELVAVATATAYRRRGFASLICGYLCNRHFLEGGSSVWLSAAPDGLSVYSKLGFARVGDQLNFEHPGS